MKKTEKFPLVVVEFLDHYMSDPAGDARDDGLVCFCTGFLWKETETSIWLVPWIAPTAGIKENSEVYVILKSTIKNRFRAKLQKQR